MYEQRFKSHHDASRRLKNKFVCDTDAEAYLAGVLDSPAETRRAIYLHVPFCNKICSFCPFHRPDALKRREYDGYLIREIEALSGFEYMRAPVDAINFGGGTPTALLPEQMSRVLKSLHDNFDIAKNAEISVETSITELSSEMIAALREGGVNRLSIGVQTFDDAGRKLLNRRGDGERAVNKIKQLKAAGFENVGIDLIYNYPGETMEILERDLEIIRAAELAGISFYSLMLHEGTPIIGKITEEQMSLMRDIGREKAFFDLILDKLYPVGYKPMELTKLVRNGLDRYEYMTLRHSGGSCIAVGSGAGGNIENYYYGNRKNYTVFSPEVPVSRQGKVFSYEYRIYDEFINDLQKMTVNTDVYSERLGFKLMPRIAGFLERAEREKLLTVDGPNITLLHDGIFWGNNIIDELIKNIIGE